MSTSESVEIDLSFEWAALNDVYDMLWDWLDADARYTAVPSVSAWTPAQHVYHIARANASMLKAAQVLASGDADAEEPNLKPAGRSILRRGTIPRGVANAPDVVRPPDDVDDVTLRKSLVRSRQKFEDVRDLGDALLEAEGGLTHPLWGTLTASEWVRAARIHAEHHLAILDDIAAA